MVRHIDRVKPEIGHTYNIAYGGDTVKAKYLGMVYPASGGWLWDFQAVGRTPFWFCGRTRFSLPYCALGLPVGL